MILLTGAAGKTGKAILNTLLPHGVKVRALARSTRQVEELKAIGCKDIMIGDLRDEQSLDRAMEGVEKIYYICPNITPDEVQIGNTLISLAKKHSIERFVYHSVLHPQAEAMPHHWQKLRMEEALLESGLDFTILQPCAYMQNVLAGWSTIVENGIYSVPYAVSARLSIVDLVDVGAAAEVVLTQRIHSHAIYELAGPEALSQDEVAQILSAELGKPVRAISVDRGEWAENSRRAGLDERSIMTLLKMFEYYESHGLVGNANVMNYLLKRPATQFVEFVHKTVTAEQRRKSGS